MALHALRRLAVLAATLTTAIAATPADAAVYQLRPDSTFLASGWTATPAGTTLADATNDAVVAPTAPSTATDYVSSTQNNALSLYVGNLTLAPGETVTGVKVHMYLAAGSNRAPTVFLIHDLVTLATTAYPAGSPAGWYTTTYTGSLTQAELDALYLGVTPQGNGGSTPTYVYAAYAEVTTSDPPPSDPPPSDPPPSDPPPSDPPPSDPPPSDPPPSDPPPGDSPTDPPPATPVPTDNPTTPSDPTTPDPDAGIPVVTIVEPALDIAGTTTTATPQGDVPVRASCARDRVGGCQGVIWLEEALDVAGAKLRAARRTPKRFSKSKRYKLNPGQSRTIPVRLDRRTYRKFRRKRSFKVAVAVQEKGPQGQVLTERRTFRVFNKTKKKRRN
jgi:hypothetical protein